MPIFSQNLSKNSRIFSKLKGNFQKTQYSGKSTNLWLPENYPNDNPEVYPGGRRGSRRWFQISRFHLILILARKAVCFFLLSVSQTFHQKLSHLAGNLIQLLTNLLSHILQVKNFRKKSQIKTWRKIAAFWKGLNKEKRIEKV